VEESHLGGDVLSFFFDGDVKMAVVSWPVIGGTTTEVTDYREEEVKIDDLY